MSQLRAGHAADDNTRIGVDVIAGTVGDMSKLGIYEAFKVSTSLAAQRLHVITGCGPKTICVCML